MEPWQWRQQRAERARKPRSPAKRRGQGEHVGATHILSPSIALALRQASANALLWECWGAVGCLPGRAVTSSEAPKCTGLERHAASATHVWHGVSIFMCCMSDLSSYIPQRLPDLSENGLLGWTGSWMGRVYALCVLLPHFYKFIPVFIYFHC